MPNREKIGHTTPKSYFIFNANYMPNHGQNSQRNVNPSANVA